MKKLLNYWYHCRKVRLFCAHAIIAFANAAALPLLVLFFPVYCCVRGLDRFYMWAIDEKERRANEEAEILAAFERAI